MEPSGRRANFSSLQEWDNPEYDMTPPEKDRSVEDVDDGKII
jgi:hypothetical protein